MAATSVMAVGAASLASFSGGSAQASGANVTTAPLRAAVMTSQFNGNLVNYCTHSNCSAAGSDSNNYWAIDLFDYSTNAQIFNTKANTLYRNIGCGNPGGLGVRIGPANGTAVQRIYCHGRDRQFGLNAYVAAGAVVMKIDNSIAGSHLHYEARYLETTNWATQFHGICANRELLNQIYTGVGTIQWAWSQPVGAPVFKSNCSW